MVAPGDFARDFLDFMPDRVTVTPGVVDEYGAFIASGQDFIIQCRVEGSNRMTRDMAGREVVSTIQIFVGGTYDEDTEETDCTPIGLTEDLHRYTLPSRFNPNSLRTAVTVERNADEDGPQFEVVYI